MSQTYSLDSGDGWRFDSWYSILLSFLIWSTGYFIARFALPEKSPEYCCRIVGTLHGSLSAFIGINQCFLIDWPFEHPEWRTTMIQSYLLSTSLGYFIYDLIWCCFYQLDSKLMIAHHIYSVISLWRILYKGYTGGQATCALGSMEITNPLLQFRWFLRSEGYYPSMLFTCVEVTFMVIFFFIRIVLGTFFLIMIVFQPRNDWDFRIFSCTIYIMSWMFMVNIFKYFINKYGVGRQLGDLNNKGT